ncbi:diacylglycerol acyltransferase-domain-containing protein [Tirmania nivea]|nr:diacylglycerol acyltransferase-domain-containing protein [Tirmania nivea]
MWLLTPLLTRKRIRFAPLRIPLHRRLQTLSILWHELTPLLLLTVFYTSLVNPLLWPLLIPYLLHLLLSTSHSNGSPPYIRSHHLRSLPIWKYFNAYFPITLHRTVALDPKMNYIFGYQPHGIISIGAFGCFATDDGLQGGFGRLFPGIRNTLLTLEGNFRVPFYREYLLAMGLGSVHPYIPRQPAPLGTSIPTTTTPDPSLPRGNAISIVLGGAHESLLTFPHTYRLILRKRRGFLKLALTNPNTALIPVLAFGENDLYETLVPERGTWLDKAQKGAKRWFGWTVPVFWARGVFNYDVGLVPFRAGVEVVCGRPVVPRRWRGGGEGGWEVGEVGGKVKDVTEEEVMELQEEYITELRSVWEKWKDVFAPGRREDLEIVE